MDAFLNVSSSEGIPVSIMEVQSCGIPVIATAVGGVREIVGEKTGVLLSANPSETDIANAISSVTGNDIERSFQFREAIRAHWRKRFNAYTNYRAFNEQLMSLADSPNLSQIRAECCSYD